MMTERDRFVAALSGGDADRVPLCELAFWPETVSRFEAEGMPRGVSLNEYFGLDRLAFFTYDGDLGYGEPPRPDGRGYELYRAGNGVVYRQRTDGASSTPVYVDSIIREAADWEEHRSRLLPGMERFELPYGNEAVTGYATGCGSQRDYYARAVSERLPAILSPTDAMWFYLRLMAEERSLCDISLEPDRVEGVLSDYTDFNIAMYKRLYESGLRFDAVWVFSDLCYKGGMLFSPGFYESRALPHLRRYIDVCREGGSRFIFHSDGDLRELIPLLRSAGVDCVQPLEARAGNDVRLLVKEYGDALSFMGNISADVLSGGKDGIFHEVSDKVTKAKEHRRYIFHSDHSIPPGVSLENYQYALSLAREYGSY